MNAFRGRITMMLLGAGSLAQAGAIIETVSRDLPDGKETSGSTMYVEGGKLRVDHREGAAKSPVSTMIYKDDTLYIVNHAEKSYTAIDRATVKKVAGQMSAALKQVETELAKMPPEQRATVEQMMGHGGQQTAKHAPPEYRQTARSETAAGHNCRIWEGMQAGAKIAEYCVVPYSSVAGGQEMLAVMKHMMSLSEEMYNSLSASLPKDASLTTDWEGVKAIDGYPALIRSFAGGRAASEDLLKSARNTSVSAAQFEVPAGYRRETMEGVQ